MSAIMETRDLNLWYGSHQALHSVNVALPEHEITALIGPSGCGKSTFLKTLNRMNDLVPGIRIEGEVNYGGQNIYDSAVDPTWLRRQVGMVFQKPNPFPMSIYDNVAYGPRTHGIRSRAKLDEIVEISLRSAAIWDEVKDRLKKSALGLSGGQQQRLGIARALTKRADLYIFDDSFSALDFQTDAALRRALRQEVAGSAVLIIAQRVSTIAHADQIIVLEDGRAVGIGRHEELLETCPVYREIAQSQGKGGES